MPLKDHKPDSAPSADRLADAATTLARKGPAPVHLWNPPYCGDLDIRIARNGTWHYLGSPIGRQPLVRLFASILKREGERFYLVTPVEKVGIVVEDAPFVAVDFTVDGTGRDQSLAFETNVGDAATAGPANPIRVARDPRTDEPAPYILIRDGLEALIDRKSFYRLVDLGVEHIVDGSREFGVWSDGAFFSFMRVDDLATRVSGDEPSAR